MRQAVAVLLAVAALGACSAKSVGAMDPVEGGRCSASSGAATASDGCSQCTCKASRWSCQSAACEMACKPGARKQADDGCNTCSCTADGAWDCTSGADCSSQGDGSAGSQGTGSGGSISGTIVTTPVVGQCAGTVAMPPAHPPSTGTALPCDIYAEDGGPCVAAHSTVRALYATYDGPLYQVKNDSGATADIPLLTPGGFADSAAQDDFCGTGLCTISVIYDQSGHGNHLTKAPAGGAKSTPGNEANAKATPATFGGHKVYGLHVAPGVGYRNNDACGTATGDDAETEYMIVAGDYHNGGCCFDYGNVERNSRDEGEGAAEAIYFGSTTIWGKGSGDGPWVMGDLENGLWAGDVTPYAANTSLSFAFVTALLKGDAAGQNHWAIKSGNAQAGALTTMFDGQRPSARYNPMQKQGGIALGTAGDNSNAGQGNFFEGVMTAHFSSDSADEAVQANVVSVYGSP